MSRPPLELEEEDDPPSFKHPERCEAATDEDPVKDDDDVEIGDECRAETEVESDKILERAMQNELPCRKKSGTEEDWFQACRCVLDQARSRPGRRRQARANTAGGGSATAPCQGATMSPTATGILGYVMRPGMFLGPNGLVRYSFICSSKVVKPELYRPRGKN
jgi:hypothetical protein